MQASAKAVVDYIPQWSLEGKITGNYNQGAGWIGDGEAVAASLQTVIEKVGAILPLLGRGSILRITVEVVPEG